MITGQKSIIPVTKLYTNTSTTGNHSVLSLKVRILEKIYHTSNRPQLSTPHRRKREEYWIKHWWVLLPRMDAMTRLIESGTSQLCEYDAPISSFL